MAEPWIELKNVSFRYNDTDEMALKNINVTINRGEKVLILGANGSGKSTLIHLLAGQLDGQGEVFGEYHLNDESHNVFEPLVADNLQWLQLPSGRAIVDRWHYFLNEHLKASNAKLLSAGEKTIYQFLNALSHSQGVFIFDEPLRDLSPRASELFVEVLDDFYQDDVGRTVIVSEHHLEEMMHRSLDRVLVMLDGRLVFDGALDSLLRQNLLSAMGIREPLYLTALRYAGYPLDQLKNISQVSQLRGAELASSVRSWMMAVPNFVYPTPGEPLIELEDNSFRYGSARTRGIADVSLTVRRGEMISLVGDNGSGKTTLAHLLSGKVDPQSGQLRWQGEPVTEVNRAEFIRRVAYFSRSKLKRAVSQTIDKLMDEVIAHYHLQYEDNAQMKLDVLEKMRLSHVSRDVRIGDLSTIKQFRVMMASLLLREPEVLVVEAPTEAQDFTHFRHIMNDLYRLNTEDSLTILITTHDIEAMLEYTRRAIVLSGGKIIADTSPVQVITTPDIIQRAALRETSLNQLAAHLDLADPYLFIQKFMDYDREVQQHF
ncbi:MAG: DUF3744 domain-containing protein [Aerococcus sp.]|nr:DUF3744 domain-containing protein [Aerococcus sp.]